MNTISTPVIILNISPAIWSEVPLPEAAKLSLPGLLFASAMNSATDFAGTEGFTTMTFGMRAIIAVAARYATRNANTMRAAMTPPPEDSLRVFYDAPDQKPFLLQRRRGVPIGFGVWFRMVWRSNSWRSLSG